MVEQSHQDNFIDNELFNLFCIELENQCAILNEKLVEFEGNPQDRLAIESLMRAAHSIKGAARTLGLDSISELAHKMEDTFLKIQNHALSLNLEKINQLLKCIDFLSELSKCPVDQFNGWLTSHSIVVNALGDALSFSSSQSKLPASQSIEFVHSASIQDRVFRLTARHFDQLMNLTGEALVQAHCLQPLSQSFRKYKIFQDGISRSLDFLKESLQEKEGLSEPTRDCLNALEKDVKESKLFLSQQFEQLESFSHRHEILSDQLYQHAIRSRMRPFGDATIGFSRLVRDLTLKFNKKARLEISGNDTLVDREILETLQDILTHLLRNALDHGIESPEKRQEIGKNPEGLIKIEASHQGDSLHVLFTDDGQGINFERIKEQLVKNKFIDLEKAKFLSNQELLNYLFLSGFSTKDEVTDISGRGVGLDVVRKSIEEVGGKIRVISIMDQGTKFLLELPLTLSVIQTLIVEISEEEYAIPLTHLMQVIVMDLNDLQDGFMLINEKKHRVVYGWEILELEKPKRHFNSLSVVIIGRENERFGVIVERFLEEKELVIQKLPAQLEKVKDILAGAIMDNEKPLLIIDVEDLIQSIIQFSKKEE